MNSEDKVKLGKLRGGRATQVIKDKRNKFNEKPKHKKRDWPED